MQCKSHTAGVCENILFGNAFSQMRHLVTWNFWSHETWHETFDQMKHSVRWDIWSDETFCQIKLLVRWNMWHETFDQLKHSVRLNLWSDETCSMKHWLGEAFCQMTWWQMKHCQIKYSVRWKELNKAVPGQWFHHEMDITSHLMFWYFHLLQKRTSWWCNNDKTTIKQSFNKSVN